MVSVPLGRMSLFALREVSQSGPAQILPHLLKLLPPTPPYTYTFLPLHPTPFPIVLRHRTTLGLLSPLLTQYEKRFRKSAVGDY